MLNCRRFGCMRLVMIAVILFEWILQANCQVTSVEKFVQNHNHATLTCTFDKDYKRREWRFERNAITSGDHTTDGRFSTDCPKNSSYCHLTINEATEELAGLYQCMASDLTSGLNVKMSYQLVVGGLYCNSNIGDSQALIAKNDCPGLDATKLMINCTFTYKGSSSHFPLKWLHKWTNGSLVERSTVQTREPMMLGGDISIMGSISATREMADQYFECFIEGQPSVPSCTLKRTNIMYAFNSTLETIESSRDVTCQANKSDNTRCEHYSWHYSNKQLIDFKLSASEMSSPGRYRCIAECFIDSHRCSILAKDLQLIKIESASSTTSTTTTIVVIVVVAVLLALIALAVFIFYRIRKKKLKRKTDIESSEDFERVKVKLLPKNEEPKVSVSTTPTSATQLVASKPLIHNNQNGAGDGGTEGLLSKNEEPKVSVLTIPTPAGQLAASKLLKDNQNGARDSKTDAKLDRRENTKELLPKNEEPKASVSIIPTTTPQPAASKLLTQNGAGDSGTEEKLDRRKDTKELLSKNEEPKASVSTIPIPAPQPAAVTTQIGKEIPLNDSTGCVSGICHFGGRIYCVTKGCAKLFIFSDSPPYNRMMPEEIVIHGLSNPQSLVACRKPEHPSIYINDYGGTVVFRVFPKRKEDDNKTCQGKVDGNPAYLAMARPDTLVVTLKRDQKMHTEVYDTSRSFEKDGSVSETQTWEKKYILPHPVDVILPLGICVSGCPLEGIDVSSKGSQNLYLLYGSGRYSKTSREFSSYKIAKLDIETGHSFVTFELKDFSEVAPEKFVPVTLTADESEGGIFVLEASKGQLVQLNSDLSRFVFDVRVGVKIQSVCIRSTERIAIFGNSGEMLFLVCHKIKHGAPFS